MPYSRKEIICPYCGYAITPDEGCYYSEDYTEEMCSDCENYFSVSVHISASWTTFRKLVA